MEIFNTKLACWTRNLLSSLCYLSYTLISPKSLPNPIRTLFEHSLYLLRTFTQFNVIKVVFLNTTFLHFCRKKRNFSIYFITTTNSILYNDFFEIMKESPKMSTICLNLYKKQKLPASICLRNLLINNELIKLKQHQEFYLSRQRK